jgi:putative membrane protein
MYWHGQSMMGWGWMPFHGVLSLLLLIIVIAAAVAIVRGLSGRSGPPASPVGRSPGLDVLAERYAKGEIERDEYLRKKSDIGG